MARTRTPAAEPDAAPAPPPEAPPVVEPDAELVTELELELTFEVGRTRMTVEDLRSIQAGYVFELDADVERPVSIHANGRPVAQGRLVRVGDRLAVQATEVGNHAR